MVIIIDVTGHLVTYLVHLLEFISLYSFISLTITREGVIRITNISTAARGIILLGSLSADLLDIIHIVRNASVVSSSERYEHAALFI